MTLRFSTVAFVAITSLLVGCGGSDSDDSAACPAGSIAAPGANSTTICATEDGTIVSVLDADGNTVDLSGGIPEGVTGTEAPTTEEGGEGTAGEEAGGETSGEEAGGETSGEEAGGETSGEEAGGETSGEEAGGEGDTPGGEQGGGVAKEDCINGSDDDGDGLVDCEDPECATQPACSKTEDCTNGTDDNDDGLVDCDDPSCTYADACFVESCSTFYICLAEKGCDCEVGKDCTFEVGDDTYGQCQITCFQNQTCNDACVSELSLGVQEDLAAYNNCTQTFCANAQTDEEYETCLLTNCATEYVDCFFEEEKKDVCKGYFSCLDENGCNDVPSDEFGSCLFDNCVEGYANCNFDGTDTCDQFLGCFQAAQCNPDTMTDDQYQDCIGPCYDAVSPAGFIDAIAWDNCRFDLCDADENDETDSTICILMASYLACGDSAGTCLPEGSFVGEGTCGDVADCLAACEDFTTPSEDIQGPNGEEITCDLVCLDQINGSTLTELGDLFTCVISNCGTFEGELTPTCIGEALTGACATEYGACQ